jgi:hypothetical protein
MPRKTRLGILLVLAIACGGSTADTPDGSANDSGDESNPTLSDASTVDVHPADAGVDAYPGFIIVDGGLDCGRPDLSPSAAYNTCCLGKPCAGRCMQWLDGGDPFCGCAGLTTGCPSNYVCCPSDNPEGTCTNSCPPTGTN